jgi:hypothetical protein
MIVDPPLDVGIAAAVEALRAAGIETFESCEGGEGHACAEPTIRSHGERQAGFAALATAMAARTPRRFVTALLADYRRGAHWSLVGNDIFPPMKTNSVERTLYREAYHQCHSSNFRARCCFRCCTLCCYGGQTASRNARVLF